MKHALEPIGRSLIFSPCCRTSVVGIEWLRAPTEDELDADDYTVQRCEDSAGWWMGDIVIARYKREGGDKTLREFAAEYARARGLNEVTVRERAYVAEFYPVTNRLVKPISWTHHHIVWGVCSGGEGLSGCVRWLQRAMQGSDGVPWSTGRLRQELRAARRDSVEPEEPPAPVGEFEEMTKIDCWAATHLALVERIDRPTARSMLTRFAATIAFVDALRARANSDFE